MGVRGLFTALVLLWASAASAASAEPVVVWEVSEGCPNASENDAELASLLGRDVNASEVPLRAAVTISRVAGGMFEARISFGERSHAERVLRDSRCQVLVHASAVILSLAIREATRKPARTAAPASRPGEPLSRSVEVRESTAASSLPQAEIGSADISDGADNGSASLAAQPTEGARSAAPPIPAPPSEEETVEILSQAPPTIRRAASTPGFFFTLGAALGLGILPAPGPVLGGGLGMQAPAWQLALRLSRSFAQSSMLREQAGVGGAVALTAIALDAGLRARLQVLELRALLGGELGWFGAHSVAAVSYGEQTAPWSAGYAGIGAALPWGSVLALSMRAEAVVAATRPQFTLLDRSTGEQPSFHRPARLAGRFFVELEVRLE